MRYIAIVGLLLLTGCSSRPMTEAKRQEFLRAMDSINPPRPTTTTVRVETSCHQLGSNIVCN